MRCEPALGEGAMQNLQSAFGVFALLAVAWIVSEDRRNVAWRQAALALLLTFATAVRLLQGAGCHARVCGDQSRGRCGRRGEQGRHIVRVRLSRRGRASLRTQGARRGGLLALPALPIVLVMSGLTPLLFHWRPLPPFVRGFSCGLERTLKVGGAVGLSTAANIFLGMVEAPLFIRPYLARLTRSELFIVMTGGMAGIAGTVLVIYATLLGAIIPDAAAHFVIASVMG